MRPEPEPETEPRVVIVLAVPPDEVDLAADELFTLGASAVSETSIDAEVPGGPVELVADVPADRLGDLRRPFRELTPEAGGAATVAHDPVRVAGFVLCPVPLDATGAVAVGTTGDDADDSARTVWLDPLAAFGSGTHPTTRLCVAATVDLVRSGDTVLDVGSGNGVLSVVAARCGARWVLAIDIDPTARAATVAAAERNAVGDRVRVSDQTVADLADEFAGSGSLAGGTVVAESFAAGLPADVVLANLLVDVIEANAAALVDLVGPHGALVLSGTLSTQVDRVLDAVRAAAAGAGRTASLRSATAEGEWRALVFRLGHRRVTAR